MALTHDDIKASLNTKFGEQLASYDESYGMLCATIPAAKNLEVIQFLYNDEKMKFRFLTDLTAIHYPDRTQEELCVVYHLHNLQDNTRLRIKAYVPVAQPDIQSLTPVFKGADWLEREAYDFFGVNFLGHPNLIRIMNVEEMDYFPLRKEYPMEDPSRRDKDDEMFGRGGSQFY
ncbi:MAG: NADH-quinone oxidoreductase subunit C [Bacteroidetes bacterium]|nr:NADH-quinone oxidoreductase subunit C [Bacteroidota bacterium]